VTFQHVKGRVQGEIVIYALSTCMWCRMTKSLLKEIGVAYSYVDVDTLEGGEKDQAKAAIKRWNPSGSYPTIVIDDREAISGYDEAELRGKFS
jgi:glutaredoxin-like protein NrdH